MIVTNEKLTADVYCANRETCDGCEHRRRNCVDNSERNDYARDLLETRELIKEMREEINITLRDFEKVGEVCKIANVMPFSLTKKKLAELLEKTKEYE